MKFSRRLWSEEDRQFLIDNHKTMTNAQLAYELNRTNNAIRIQKGILGLSASKKKRAIYEVKKGYEVLAVGTVEECAEKLGIKPNSVYYYATPTHLRRTSHLEAPILATKIDDDELEDYYYELG